MNFFKWAALVGLAAPLCAQTGASGLNTKQAGTGAVSRSQQSKNNDIVHVNDFGANCNGTFDNYAAFTAAITYGFSTLGGAYVHFSGNCGVLKPILVPRGIVLVGDSSPSASTVFALPGFTPTAYSVTLPFGTGSIYKFPSSGTNSATYVIKVGNFPPAYPEGTDLHFGGVTHMQVNANHRADIGIVGENWQEQNVMEDVLVTQYNKVGTYVWGQNFDINHYYAFGEACNNPFGCLRRWVPSIPEPYLNSIVVDSNGHIQKVTAVAVPGAGNYGGLTEPTWNSSGGTTVDNQLTWTDQGTVWQSSHAYNYGDRLETGAGRYQECIQAGTTSTTLPTFSTTFGNVTDGGVIWHDEGTGGQIGILDIQGQSRTPIYIGTISNGGDGAAIDCVNCDGFEISNQHAENQKYGVWIHNGGRGSIHDIYGSFSAPITVKLGSSLTDTTDITQRQIFGPVCNWGINSSSGTATAATSSCDGQSGVTYNANYTNFFAGGNPGEDAISTTVGYSNFQNLSIFTRLTMGFAAKIVSYNAGNAIFTIDMSNFTIGVGQNSAGTGLVIQGRTTYLNGGTLFQGGGVHIQGNCANNGVVAGGNTWGGCGSVDIGAITDGATWISRATVAEGLVGANGTLCLWTQAGLSAGATFSPACQINIGTGFVSLKGSVQLPLITTPNVILGYDGTKIVADTPLNAITALSSGVAPTANTLLGFDGTKMVSQTPVQGLTDLTNGVTPTANELLAYDGTKVITATPTQAITDLGSGTAPTSNAFLAFNGSKLISLTPALSLTYLAGGTAPATNGILSYTGTVLGTLTPGASIAYVSGGAGTTYTGTEQSIINSLVSTINTLINELANAGVISH